MGWLSKLLKASSSSAKGKSVILSAPDDDSQQSLSSSRNSSKGEAQSESSEEVIADECCSNHHWHDELASHLSQSAGLSVESPPPTYHHQDNHHNSYYVGYGFQPYSSPLHQSSIGQGDGHDFNWTDGVWPIHVSNNTTNQFTALQYDDRTSQYFSDGYGNRHTICDICKEHIPVNSSGALQVKEDPIWQLKYCLKHLKDGTPKCFSCKRFEALDKKYSSHESGRKICADCKPYVIMNIKDCQPLIQEIYEFYEELNMRLYQSEIQIDVIETKEMKRLHGPRTRGITFYKETCIISTRLRTTGKRFKLVSHKEVKNICLEAGRPRLLIGHTLAHEMMHAWLSLEGFVGNPTEGFVGQLETEQIHEGICQVMAHKWLQSQVECLHLGSNFEIKLAQHCMRDIEDRRDDPYGKGFQIVNPAVNKYGLRGTLDYIRMNGKLPQ